MSSTKFVKPIKHIEPNSPPIGMIMHSQGGGLEYRLRTPIQEKTKNFMWRLLKNILPTRQNLSKKGITVDLYCPFCHSCTENSNHLFIECAFAKRIFFSPPLGIRTLVDSDVFDWITFCLNLKDTWLAQMVCTGMSKLWQARNDLIFKNEAPNPQFLASTIVEQVLEWKNHLQPKSSNLEVLDRGLLPNFGWIVQSDVGCFEGVWFLLVWSSS